MMRNATGKKTTQESLQNCFFPGQSSSFIKCRDVLFSGFAMYICFVKTCYILTVYTYIYIYSKYTSEQQLHSSSFCQNLIPSSLGLFSELSGLPSSMTVFMILPSSFSFFARSAAFKSISNKLPMPMKHPVITPQTPVLLQEFLETIEVFNLCHVMRSLSSNFHEFGVWMVMSCQSSGYK